MFYNFFHSYLETQSIWILTTFSCVAVAMTVDLVTGILKSRRLGYSVSSKGLKRTCDKAVKYFLPMLCLCCVDILAAVITKWPVLTIVFGAYCIICEVKSVFESTSQKKAIMDAVKNAQTILTDRSELIKIVKSIINESQQ